MLVPEAGCSRAHVSHEEYTQNSFHLNNAINVLIKESSNNQGGDTGGTHVWWDRKANK